MYCYIHTRLYYLYIKNLYVILFYVHNFKFINMYLSDFSRNPLWWNFILAPLLKETSLAYTSFFFNCHLTTGVSCFFFPNLPSVVLLLSIEPYSSYLKVYFLGSLYGPFRRKTHLFFRTYFHRLNVGEFKSISIEPVTIQILVHRTWDVYNTGISNHPLRKHRLTMLLKYIIDSGLDQFPLQFDNRF